jgi:hypothetical protein
MADRNALRQTLATVAARSVALLSVVAGLTVAASAGAASQSSQLIRHGVGVGKARLGMTEAQVRAALGRPTWVVQRRTGFGGVRRELQFGEAAYSVVFRRRAGAFRAVAVNTILSRERTPEGLGVGSLETRVRRAYGSRLRCEPLRTRLARGSTMRVLVSNTRSCALPTSGRTETVFESVVKGRFAWSFVKPEDWPRARVYLVTVRLAGSS